MHETLVPGRESESPLAGLVVDILGPLLELIVAQRVQVGAAREVRQGLLVGYHHERSLHPGYIVDVLPVKPAQLHEIFRECPVPETGKDLVQGPQRAFLVELYKIPVQRSHQDGRGGIALQHRIDLTEQEGIVVGPEIDLAGEVLQDLVPHLPRFLHGIHLG